MNIAECAAAQGTDLHAYMCCETYVYVIVVLCVQISI